MAATLKALRKPLVLTASEPTFDISKVKIRRGTRQQGGEETFRAFYGPKRIGYLMLGADLPKSKAADGFAPHERTVYNTAVADEYKRKGIGSLLYDAASAYCKSIGQELVPSMGMPLHSVSDEAYKLWQKRAPNHPRVLNDARRYEEQYAGKPIEKDGEQWTIEHTAGAKGFTIRNADGTKTGWIAAAPVYAVYGNPGEPMVKKAAGPVNITSDGKYGPYQMTIELLEESEDGEEWNEYELRTTLDGHLVGTIEYSVYPEYVYPRDTWVSTEHRRKGIATAMYQFLENTYGRPMRKGDTQSEDGQALWRQNERSFGAGKTAFISPRDAELTIAIDQGTRSNVTIGLDFGIPNFTQFTITVPITGLEAEAISAYCRQAFGALIDDVSAFMVSLKYDEDAVVDVLSLAEVCFHELTGKDATDAGMSDPDPNLRVYEGSFKMPEKFVEETFKKVVTAAVKTPGSAVDTPEFKAWFGDSKVVDGSGAPLVVYHGTQAKFDTFQSSSRGSLGSGIYFANENTARDYGDGKVKAVYLKMTNPFRYAADFEAEPDLDFESEAVPLIRQLFPEKTGHYLILRSMQTDGMFGPEVEREIRKLGHDGIIATYEDGSVTWVVYEPNQIKSAEKNKGKFDPSNPSITASVVRRVPEIREIALIPLDGANAAKDTETVIEFYRDQSTKNTPRAFDVRIHESLTEPVGKRIPAKDWQARLIP